MDKHRCVFLLFLFLVPFTLAQGQHKCITQSFTGDPPQARKYEFGTHQVELVELTPTIECGEADLQVEVCANHLNLQQFNRAGLADACSAEPQFYSGFKKIVVHEVN